MSEAKSEVWSSVEQVFRSVMDNDELELSEDTTANDVAEWDSITHVLLMAEIEKKFGFRFSAEEITGMKNVGELISVVETKSG